LPTTDQSDKLASGVGWGLLALDWLAQLEGDTPYFLYLSHKAVHSDFVPADRHRGRYADRLIPLPATYPDTPENHDDKPM